MHMLPCVYERLVAFGVRIVFLMMYMARDFVCLFVCCVPFLFWQHANDVEGVVPLPKER